MSVKADMPRCGAVLIFLSLGLAAAGGWTAWHFRDSLWMRVSSSKSVLKDRGEAERVQAKEQWSDYAGARAAGESRRVELSGRWAAASPSERAVILKEAAGALTDTIGKNLAPFWYGTPWDFNGTTEVPQKGCIACGYFVSTMLKHSGVNVERVRLAQQASQNIILTLTAAPYLHKGHGMPLEAFAAKIKALGPGLSIVGLDNHVGILWHDGSELWFLHSTVAETKDVIKERAADSRVLGDSKYRIVGQITADPALIEAWLTGRFLRTYQPPPRPA